MNDKSHRWTNDELKTLMKLWGEKVSLHEIALKLNATTCSILKMVNKLRKNGIPLEKREKGHRDGVSWRAWTQGEIEYLLRRRSENATSEEIANDLNRTWNAVCGMIYKLRSEEVVVQKRASGKSRLWDVEALRATAIRIEQNK